MVAEAANRAWRNVFVENLWTENSGAFSGGSDEQNMCRSADLQIWLEMPNRVVVEAANKAWRILFVEILWTENSMAILPVPYVRSMFGWI